MSVGAGGSAWNSPTVYTKVQFVLAGVLILLSAPASPAVACACGHCRDSRRGCGPIDPARGPSPSGTGCRRRGSAPSPSPTTPSCAGSSVVLALSGLLATAAAVLTLVPPGVFSATRLHTSPSTMRDRDRRGRGHRDAARARPRVRVQPRCDLARRIGPPAVRSPWEVDSSLWRGWPVRLPMS